MSAFLGHIHYWLYRKIQLLVERENLILEKTTKVVDDLAEELHSISVDTYGEPINPSIPLENIIDHGNIHGWLSNQINIASVREAAFIKDLLDTNSGDEAVHVVTAILDAFAVQGQACGVVAQDNLEEHTAPAIYNALQNFYVNGMPCDGGFLKAQMNSHGLGITDYKQATGVQRALTLSSWPWRTKHGSKPL